MPRPSPAGWRGCGGGGGGGGCVLHTAYVNSTCPCKAKEQGLAA